MKTKLLRVKKDTWKELMTIKVRDDFENIDELINKLLKLYEVKNEHKTNEGNNEGIFNSDHSWH